jgi:hypothetical protein
MLTDQLSSLEDRLVAASTVEATIVTGREIIYGECTNIRSSNESISLTFARMTTPSGRRATREGHRMSYELSLSELTFDWEDEDTAVCKLFTPDVIITLDFGGDFRKHGNHNHGL